MLKQMLKTVWLYIIFCMVRLLVALRYRIVFIGLDELEKSLSKKKGVLFLPNHPAEIDPVILMMGLWPKLRPKPLVVDYFYRIKRFRFFLDLVGALPLPNLDTFVNKWKTKKVEKLFADIVLGLKRGERFLIYPAGRLKLNGYESIGGASFVHNLVQAYPEVQIVLVRTSGLWGSRFSRALSGSVPDMKKELWEGFKIILKNGIFFVPRRQVKVELSGAPPGFPYLADRVEFNKYLERWYNQYPQKGPESPPYVQ